MQHTGTATEALAQARHVLSKGSKTDVRVHIKGDLTTRRKASLWTSSKATTLPRTLANILTLRPTAYKDMTSHHAMTLALGDKLYLAPLDKDKVHVRLERHIPYHPVTIGRLP